MNSIATKGETWQSDQPDLLELVTENPVPRRGAWGFQFRRDLRHAHMWVIWILGLGCVAGGAASGFWQFAVLGVTALLMIGWMYYRISEGYRRLPLALGVIDRLGPHWRSKQFATAHARLRTSEADAAVVLPRARIQDLIEKHGKLEVLILLESKNRFSRVVGWRPLTEGSEAD